MYEAMSSVLLLCLMDSSSGVLQILWMMQKLLEVHQALSEVVPSVALCLPDSSTETSKDGFRRF